MQNALKMEGNHEELVRQESSNLVPFIESGELQVLKNLDDEVFVFYRGVMVASYDRRDRFARNFAIVQLHFNYRVKHRVLSMHFGLAVSRIEQLIGKYREGRSRGLEDRTFISVQNGRKIKGKIAEFIIEQRSKDEPPTYEAISEMIRKKYRKRISHLTVSVWWRTHKKRQGDEEKKQEMKQEMKQLVLVGEVGAEVEAVLQPNLKQVSSSVALVKKVHEPELVIEEQWRSNVVAGSFILYALIERSRMLKPFIELISGKEFVSRSGVQRVMLTLFFLNALRGKSIEQTKHLSEEHFSPLVGGLFHRVQALRYAIDQIVEHKRFDEALMRYYQSLAIQTSIGDEVYYTDGHFSRYYGKKRIPMGYDAKRQSPARGRNNVYLHNSEGHCVYFFESPTNTTLSVDIGVLVKKMKEIYGGVKGKTLFFDRGGFSAKCFKGLKQDGMYWGTYLKHRKKEALIPTSEFKTYEYEVDGKKKKFRIFEKEKETKKYGVVRKIVFIGREGEQIPVITTNPKMKALDVLRNLKSRWREENAFKYMGEHYRFDLLTTYKTEECPEKIIKRVNPERKEMNKEISAKKSELFKLQSQLAVELGEVKNKGEVTLAEFEERQKDLNFQIKNAEVDIAMLERKKNYIASKIEMNLADEHVISGQKRRLLINLMKCMNYNSEKWLQEIFCQFHTKADETLSMIRTVLKQPGRIRWVGDTLEVELEKLDNKAHAQVLDQVINKLNDYNYLKLSEGRKLKIWQAI